MVVLIGIILLIAYSIINQPVEENNNGGFSIEIIHRDSPLLNPNLSHHELQQIAFERIASSDLTYDDGLYLMKIWYGTPSVELVKLLDTGNNIPWIQCLPCIHCFPSRYEAFNPSMSTTFKLEMCDSNQSCRYLLEYGCNSTTRGVLARETIMVGTTSHRVPVENFLFGCGNENLGFYPRNTASIIGFSPKEKSFISQLSSKHHGKFSLCLTTSSSVRPGRISFGDDANVSGSRVIMTSLILDSHYNVMSDAITIRVKKIQNSWNQSENTDENKNEGPVGNINGKMVVDSGANVIYLSDSMYPRVENGYESKLEKTTKKFKKILSVLSRNVGGR